MPSGTVFLLHGGQSVGVAPLQSLGTNPYHHLAAEWKMRAHTRTHTQGELRSDYEATFSRR